MSGAFSWAVGELDMYVCGRCVYMYVAFDFKGYVAISNSTTCRISKVMWPLVIVQHAGLAQVMSGAFNDRCILPPQMGEVIQGMCVMYVCIQLCNLGSEMSQNWITVMQQTHVIVLIGVHHALVWLTHQALSVSLLITYVTIPIQLV